MVERRILIALIAIGLSAALGAIGTGIIETSEKLACVINHSTAGSDTPGVQLIAQTHVCR